MFETFAIFGLDGDTTQVVVADMHPDVAFDDKTRPYDSLYRQARTKRGDAQRRSAAEGHKPRRSLRARSLLPLPDGSVQSFPYP